MFAHIDVSKKITRIVRYHENKVKLGKARLIDGNTAKDLGDMSHRDKLFHFQRRNSLNDKVTRNTIHVLLSWQPGDAVDNQRMRSVARGYLQEMKLYDQPYLVYRHDDREHPHLHIVCSNVTSEGKRIALRRSDFYRTHQVVETLDRRYAQGIRQRTGREENVSEAALLPRVSAALDEVIPAYKYTSLPELNAVLERYRLKATRGREDSLTYRKGGLMYQPIKPDGKESGLYVKASVLDSRPTLKHLEKRFAENAGAREVDAPRVRTAIDWAFYVGSPDLEGLRQALSNERIGTVIRRDGEGRLAGIYYIDERNKSVFDGSALGEAYSATSIERRCDLAAAERQEQEMQLAQEPAERLRIYV